MSIAASQANAFYSQVATGKSVYTFMDEDESFLVFRVRDKEVVPFWSSRPRMLKIQADHLKYSQYEISEIPLAEFLTLTLRQFQEENINVGTNWTGPKLVGYDSAPDDIRRNIEHHVNKSA